VNGLSFQFEVARDKRFVAYKRDGVYRKNKKHGDKSDIEARSYTFEVFDASQTRMLDELHIQVPIKIMHTLITLQRCNTIVVIAATYKRKSSWALIFQNIRQRGTQNAEKVTQREI